MPSQLPDISGKTKIGPAEGSFEVLKIVCDADHDRDIGAGL